MPHDSKLIALIAIGFVLALTFGLLAARRILELARERNRRIAVIVRTHSSSELASIAP